MPPLFVVLISISETQANVNHSMTLSNDYLTYTSM